MAKRSVTPVHVWPGQCSMLVPTCACLPGSAGEPGFTPKVGSGAHLSTRLGGVTCWYLSVHVWPR